MSFLICVLCFIVGAIFGVIIQALLSYQKFNEAYWEGYQHGRDKALHRIERSKKDERNTIQSKEN